MTFSLPLPSFRTAVLLQTDSLLTPIAGTAYVNTDANLNHRKKIKQPSRLILRKRTENHIACNCQLFLFYKNCIFMTSFHSDSVSVIIRRSPKIDRICEGIQHLDNEALVGSSAKTFFYLRNKTKTQLCGLAFHPITLKC